MLGNRRSKHANYCPDVDTYRVPRIQRMDFTLYYLGLFPMKGKPHEEICY